MKTLLSWELVHLGYNVNKAKGVVGLSNQSLGIQNGKLAPCPSSPNCVSTQSEDSSKKMEPLPFKGDISKTKQKLKTILASYPRTEIQNEDRNYIHSTFNLI